jgi:hypothetical protein
MITPPFSSAYMRRHYFITLFAAIIAAISAAAFLSADSAGFRCHYFSAIIAAADAADFSLAASWASEAPLICCFSDIDTFSIAA